MANDIADNQQRPKRRKRITFDSLPLFASDHELAVALLGTERARAWRSLIPLYERQGLPKIDPLMGGRYTPAVKVFFDRQYGLTPATVAAPPGVERVIDWKPRKRRGFARD